MCEFISWIEKDDDVLFLTDEDIESEHGREVLSFKDNDVIGHGAIRRFYNIENGRNCENKDFWNGKIPEKIKIAWNTGRLDYMIKYLQHDDILYIIENATNEFSKFIFSRMNQEYETCDWCAQFADLLLNDDWKAMSKNDVYFISIVGLLHNEDWSSIIKNENWIIRIIGLLCTHNYHHMLCDDNYLTRFIGLLHNKNWTRMLRDKHMLINLVGFAHMLDDCQNENYIADTRVESALKYICQNENIINMIRNKDYDNMASSTDLLTRILGLIYKKDWSKMIEDSDCSVRFVGLGYREDFATMIKDKNNFIRFIGLAMTKDWETMSKDDYRDTRLIGLAIQKNWDQMSEDKCDFIRVVGMIHKKEWNKMKKDDYRYIREIGMICSQDWDSMLKDINPSIKMRALAHEVDGKHVARPIIK